MKKYRNISALVALADVSILTSGFAEARPKWKASFPSSSSWTAAINYWATLSR